MPGREEVKDWLRSRRMKKRADDYQKVSRENKELEREVEQAKAFDEVRSRNAKLKAQLTKKSVGKLGMASPNLGGGIKGVVGKLARVGDAMYGNPKAAKPSADSGRPSGLKTVLKNLADSGEKMYGTTKKKPKKGKV